MPPTKSWTRAARWLLTALAFLYWAVSPAAGQEYTIGPRDVLGITVWGQADLSRDYGVDPDGFIPFPLIGRVKAAGSTPKELAGELTELLGKDYLVNPQVIVWVKEYLSQKVQVLGAAEKPGVYYLTGPTTILEILSKAGGLASTAGKQVVVLRNHAPAKDGSAAPSPVVRLSLEKIQAGDPAENTRVLGQDTIIVSKAQAHSYFVFGEVKKPGGYVLDRETNILEGITIAGGFTDKASPGRTRVIRSTPEGQKVIEVDMNDILRRGREAKAVMLQESDVVVVPESFF
ncbi:MAG TPA: polysaccharide biosynthesis/export family protein [Gemmatimonadales bacterium]|nr:polysaccharide biosynthesis/export family protein [Gemmatimonadales bacterium]